jgi:trk system potassium uptake protein TrkH
LEEDPVDKHKMSPYTVLLIGFACLILGGALLLLLPFAHQPGVTVSPVDALFTSTSAVCVTGLVTVDTATTYSLFGRIVIMILIQIGGLGVATVGVFAIVMMGRRVGLRGRILLREALNLHTIHGVVGLLWWIIGITAIIEGAGALLSFLSFRENYPVWTAAGLGIFHAVSSFNNAGFDCLGGFNSLTAYEHSPLLVLTTAGLIILGGLGFIVIKEVLYYRQRRHLSLHSKIVLLMTLILIIGGTLLLKLTYPMSWLSAFFQSVTARTAGFNTINIGAIPDASLLVLMTLMVIGASPGSTGGGIKTTTAFTLMVSTFKMARQKRCGVFKRQISWEIINKAYIFFVLVVILLLIVTFLVCLMEPSLPMADVMFEVISAFATVGLTVGITPGLCAGSKVMLIMTMYLGRLGLLTLAYAWTPKQVSNLEYVEEKYIVG